MFYEFSHFGLTDEFSKEYGENFSYPSHLHNAFEFITVFEGEMKVVVDNKSYLIKKGEGIFIFPHQLHSLESSNSVHMLCIFSPEIVKAYIAKKVNLLPEVNFFKVSDFLISALNGIDEKASVVEMKGILYLLCSEFDKRAKYQKNTSADKNLIYKVFEYVENNYNRECNLLKFSEESGYSYSHISRFFKRTIGISFNKYVNYYRIQKACYQLENTDCTILQCCMDSGFTSLRTFNRNFHETLLMTPKEYRMKKKS